jgi:hypothetical protein
MSKRRRVVKPFVDPEEEFVFSGTSQDEEEEEEREDSQAAQQAWFTDLPASVLPQATSAAEREQSRRMEAIFNRERDQFRAQLREVGVEDPTSTPFQAFGSLVQAATVSVSAFPSSLYFPS